MRTSTVRLLPLLTLVAAPFLLGQQSCSSEDADGDDWTTTQGDCDDANADTYPGAPELCDGLDNDCDMEVDNGSEGTAPECPSMSCWSILAANPDAEDGTYWIDPTGVGDIMEVHCDMTTDGGGWTLLQRTVWSWSDSVQLLTGYSDWYNLTIGDIAPGYAYRLSGKLWEVLSPGMQHLLKHEARDSINDGTSCKPLYYIGTSGDYTVNGTTTTLEGLSASVNMANATELSTADSGPSSVCTQSPHYAVPWFYSYCCSTCPTFMGGYWTDEPHPMVSYLYGADLYGNNEPTVCPSGAALYGAGYAGINSMEYYVR